MSVILSSCASYKAQPLSNFYKGKEEIDKDADLIAVAKAFSQSDCEKYFDRNILNVGYQPIQLHIENRSDDYFIFRVNRASLSTASAEQVAKKVHTSTVARVASYGAASLFIHFLVIPAIVDGILSSEANSALDSDFFSKTAVDCTIYPHCHYSKVFFVPLEDLPTDFSIILTNTRTNQDRIVKVRNLDNL